MVSRIESFRVEVGWWCEGFRFYRIQGGQDLRLEVGFRVWGLGSRVWGLGARVMGLGLRVKGLGSGV